MSTTPEPTDTVSPSSSVCADEQSEGLHNTLTVISDSDASSDSDIIEQSIFTDDFASVASDISRSKPASESVGSPPPSTPLLTCNPLFESASQSPTFWEAVKCIGGYFTISV